MVSLLNIPVLTLKSRKLAPSIKLYSSVMHYHISYTNPHRHFLTISIQTSVLEQDRLEMQLPSWRPGRYELGNFAKNIRDFSVVDEEGVEVDFKKETKDLWVIDQVKGKTLTITYLYYANEVNAGSCFVDDHLFYVNPIQCCMYNPGTEEQPLMLTLDYPEAYTISLQERLKKENAYVFQNFDQLVETPFLASKTLHKLTYTIDGYANVFNIWFEGVQNVPADKIIEDFKKFTKLQLEYFGSLPVEEYDFIFIITPFKSYHGVEHTSSTIITLGPDVELFEPKMYKEFLHISSHELYHTWNIKALRPAVMKPYDLARENYSKLGFWYEGLTTLMGDLILWESGVFTDEQWNECLKGYLKVHYFNEGNKHLSVADSSFDTWLDGYEIGIPNRKVSIYQDGALCMLMIHAAIQLHSNKEESLHTVMRKLYENKDVLENGFTEDFLKQTLIEAGGEQVEDILNSYVYGTEDYIVGILEACDYLGWTLILEDNEDVFTGILGVQTMNHTKGIKVIRAIEGGLADEHGIAVGDLILEINGDKPTNTYKGTSTSGKWNLKVETKYKTFETEILATEDNTVSYKVYTIDCRKE